MATLGKMIILILILLAVSSCSVHFKGEKLELDSEPTTRVHNTTYRLEKADVL